jgi:alpha-beta hydrolase superfamily lysophospholipase
VLVWWELGRLRGTIYLPPGHGRHPAVIWLHGSGEQPRLSYGPLVAAYVNDGIAFFTYDKRGVAESEGESVWAVTAGRGTRRYILF